MKKLLLCSLLLSLHALPLYAARHIVANNGEDADGCGSKASPCRSISKAIEQASANDIIFVLPGIYGDINYDGDLEDEGEESAVETDEAMIALSKPLTIISRDGARSTIINGLTTKEFALVISADGAKFGRKLKGFSVKGGSYASVFVEASNVKLQSNKFYSADGYGLAVGCTVEGEDDDETTDFRGFSGSGVLAHNVINHNGGIGVQLCENTDAWKIRNNEISHNGGKGLEVAGSGHVFTNNVYAANLGTGLNAFESSDLKMRKQVFVANRGSGASIGANSADVKKSLFIGNSGSGIFFFSDVDVTASSIYGNMSISLGLYLSCGIFDNYDENTNIDGNYWGSSEGVGTEGADIYCTQIKPTPEIRSIAKEVRVKAARPKQ